MVHPSSPPSSVPNGAAENTARCPFARFETLMRRSMLGFCLFVALLGGLVGHQWWLQREARARIEQSRETLEHVVHVRRRMSDLLASIILFQELQNPDLLAPRIACGALCAHLPRLDRHVARSPEMEETLHRARVWDARLAASLQNAMLAAQHGAPAAEVAALIAQAREVELPQLRRKIDEIGHAEVSRLSARQAASSAATERLLLMLALMTLSAGVAVMGLYRQVALIVQRGLRAEQQARELVLEDAVTGLPNRRMLTESAPMLLHRARRHHDAAALMRVSVNGWQQVKARHGAEAGDELLRHVADRLHTTLRDSDLLVRLQDNEFVVLLDGSANAHEVLRVGQRLVAGIEEPLLLSKDVQPEIDLSIGLACFPADGQQLDNLLNAAAGALETARRAGRNRLCRAGREPVTHVLSPNAQIGPATFAPPRQPA